MRAASARWLMPWSSSILSAENLLIPLIDPAITAISTAMTVLNVIFKGTGTKQAGESDLELLTKIAAQYDADFWVDGNVLYLSRFLKEYTPRLTLTWGESLLDFSPQCEHDRAGRRCGHEIHLARTPA